MQRRPNASWHEERAGSPLGRLLVAPPQQLATQHARAQTVQMPTTPQHLGYGSVPPGIAQSERFTGAVAQHQPPGQVFSPPDFVAPTYPGMQHMSAPAQQPQTSTLSHLLSILGGGGGISGPTQPPAPPAGSPVYGPASRAFIQQYGTTPSVYAPQQTMISGGGGTAPPIAQVTPPPSVLGQRPNPSVGTRGLFQF